MKLVFLKNVCMFSEQIQFAHNQAELWSSNEKFKHIGLRFKTHLAAQGLAENNLAL